MESIASTDRVMVRLGDREPEPLYELGEDERSTNVATLERVVCAAVGGKIVLDGLRQRSWRGVALAIAGGELLRRGWTGHCRLYEALGVSTAVDRALSLPGAPEDARETEHRVMIEAKFPEYLYRLWKQPETLGRVMEQFADVTWSGPDRAHWRVRTPLGKSFEWEAWTVEDREEQVIRWESLPGAEVPSDGAIEFLRVPGRGTEVVLRLRFDPPGGAIGDALAKLWGMSPATLAVRALDRFKELAEKSAT
ncbi:MAG TPA: SRPBCC family protein [Candidatus Eisenbacteria bacterium]|nr:SRPBCC family protein [Candidatus Eisenbacteria bacterium]